ncbi:hypothetical protein SO802_005501 [Lithocarpus litseifolius]|uniref:Peptide transporter n=1 Tax=Lithocarpus litseifolius TaxID=425828 RepID=A0AAW2DL42_9ROSI
MNTHQDVPAKRPKGGLVTIPFIIANEALEKVASLGLVPNMIMYLMLEYHLGLAEGANILFYWLAATHFMPLFGAFLADSYLGRFLTIALGSIASLLGMLLLCLTAMIPEARPPPCNPFTTHSCKSPTSAQMTLLISSFAIMSIGAGGTRPCSLVFGADQLEKRDNPQSQRVLRSFFGWYYASTALSILIAFTGIVYIQDHLGWKVGFGVPAILMFFSAFLFFLASPLYVMKKPSKSFFTSFLQVLVAAYRKRKFPLPHTDLRYKWYYQKGSKLVLPTNKLWFLNRACIIRNTGKEIAPNASAASDPWNFCTIEQVEELKALIKVLPLWSTGIMVSTNVTQSSFPLLQAKSMNRHITSSFEIPAASFGLFSIIALIVWVALYYLVIVPLASKIKGKAMWLGAKQRMGIGVFLSCLAMVVSAIVENIRRGRAMQKGFMNNANEDSEMSALWLVPQYCLIGLAEAFNALGQIEFYYAELPKGMSSIAMALFQLGMGFASLTASAILSTVNKITSSGGKDSWVSKNIDKGHYDNYYWLLAVLSFINLLYFFVCSWIYGPAAVELVSEIKDGQIGE